MANNSGPTRNELILRWGRRAKDYDRRAERYDLQDDEDRAETQRLLSDAYRICATELSHIRE